MPTVEQVQIRYIRYLPFAIAGYICLFFGVDFVAQHNEYQDKAFANDHLVLPCKVTESTKRKQRWHVFLTCEHPIYSSLDVYTKVEGFAVGRSVKAYHSDEYNRTTLEPPTQKWLDRERVERMLDSWFNKLLMLVFFCIGYGTFYQRAIKAAEDRQNPSGGSEISSSH